MMSSSEPRRLSLAIAGCALFLVGITPLPGRAQTDDAKNISATTSETIEEAPPREAPYTDEDPVPEEAETAETLEDNEASKPETVRAGPRPGESARDHARELGRNPYAEGDYSGQKDRFGRKDPRDRTFSRENDELIRKGLLRISKSGEFIYTYPESEQKNAFGIRVGTFSPPNLTNPQTGTSFQSLYGTDAKTMILFEYEWQFLKLPIGKLGLAVGTGIYTATGAGFYKNPSNQPSPRAEEIYNFYMFPNSVSAIYRLQFFERQLLVPYGNAGLDYFGILETRDDGGSTKLGGGAGFHIGAGASIQLDFLSKQSMFDLDQEFGINHIYLTVDFKYINGLSSAFNVTQNLLSGGILAEF